MRRLLREHFFDMEQEIGARAIKPVGDLRQAIARRREHGSLLARLPGKNCGACGAPDCEALADDVIAGNARIDDCIFVRLEALEGVGATKADT